MADQEKCDGCGTVLDPAIQPDRAPCPFCGLMTRVIEVSIKDGIELHDSVGFKHKRDGHKLPLAEGMAGDDLFRTEQRWVGKERLIDREKNRYREKVTDPSTGKVIHQCDEPLDQHRGHGSDKAKA